VVAKLKQKALDQDANFVFKGTIKRLKASNVKQAPVSDRTAIVTVNQVIDAPANLAGYAGQAITVELSNARNAAAGKRMIFHTTSWLFAENIAVRSLYEEPDEGDASARRVAAAAPRAERAVQAHFDDADLVVSGKVVEVRLPQAGVGGRKKAMASGVQSTRISEHDPKWREAIIDVEQVHKGKSSKRQVIVRFPSSTDVAWRRAPKFEAGQQGYFMLHKEQRAAAESSGRKGKQKSATTHAAADAQTYTVRDRQDFQLYSQTGGIKSLIELQNRIKQ
jgi:hypothetical protein